MARPKVNIVIPMAGRGSRFANVGFLQPKPNIDVGGKPMITYVLDNVDSDLIEATFVLLILKEQQDEHDLIAKLSPLKPRMEFVIVDEVTEGAACTTLLGKKYFNNTDPMFVVNSDQFVEWDADAFWTKMIEEGKNGVDGNILCFHVPMELNDVKWSYAKLDAEGYVCDVQEKKVISENATVGFYYWKEGRDFVESAEKMIAEDFRVKGEFYVAPIYNFGVSAFKRKYTVAFCKKMWGLGVPADLVTFLADYHRPTLAKKFPASNYALANSKLCLISRRGNLEGANPEKENTPAYVQHALNLSFDVQVDVWSGKDGGWYLGNDGPKHKVDLTFLQSKGLWLRCGDVQTFQLVTSLITVKAFVGQPDSKSMLLTTSGHCWTGTAGQELVETSILAYGVAPDEVYELEEKVFGLCQDDVLVLRNSCIARENAVRPSKQVKLVVFDLDGVLVESRDLHYEALNQALREVAGEEYVIQRNEHLTIYDGLSTNQKLELLMVAKNLRSSLHPAVWQRKQDLTVEYIIKLVKPTEHVTEALRLLKEAGYPVAVCSNCIRNSVEALLNAIGVMKYIDVFLSNEDVVKSKPAPDLYQKISKSFCVLPEEVLVVEDSFKGFEACLRARCNLLKVASTPASMCIRHTLYCCACCFQTVLLGLCIYLLTVLMQLYTLYHPLDRCVTLKTLTPRTFSAASARSTALCSPSLSSSLWQAQHPRSGSTGPTALSAKSRSF
jgi:HAD superfamily hydrolase (TIGR01509 family)